MSDAPKSASANRQGDASIGSQPDMSAAPEHLSAPEPSPFQAAESGRFRSTLGAIGTGTFIVLAAAVTWSATRPDAPPPAMAQDQHGAMEGGDMPVPVHIDADRARRIGVTYEAATSGPLVAEVRTVGQVTYDETRVKAIAPKVHGWVEQLYVDFTGREVREGEPLLSIYSPMLVAAQEELLLAIRLAKEVENGTEDARRASADLVASARRRLSWWDIPASDIDALEQSGTVTKTLTLRSPVQGVVVEKSVLSGQRIMEGEALYRVADLSTIWVEGEIFERDLGFVRLGARVAVELQAYPGEARTGAIAYVYPTVDPATRTTRIRVALPNASGRLRPGMYATIRVPGAQRANVVSVPRSAVLATGKRVIAFVRMPDGMLEPREVELGMTSDERVEVIRGLKAGEVVVSSATFLVDAESNLGAAMGAMLNMPGMDMGGSTDMPGMEMKGQGGKPPAAVGSGTDPSMPDMPGMKMDGAAGDSTKPPVKKPPTHDHRQE